MQPKKYEKGQVFDQISNLLIGVAAISIVSVVVFLLLSNLGSNTSVSADGNASAAVTTLTNAASDIPDWIPIVIIVFVGSILIGLVSLFRR